MIGFEQVDGPLAVVRFEGQVSVAEVVELATKVKEHLQAIGGGAVYCVDCSNSGVFPPDAADALLRLMKNDNPAIARTGVLINDSAMFGLQVERMLREAGNPRRSTFRDLNSMIAWLAEVLDDDARRKLRAALTD